MLWWTTMAALPDKRLAGAGAAGRAAAEPEQQGGGAPADASGQPWRLILPERASRWRLT